MNKGILLERDGREGIVLTPRGEFKRVRLTRPAAVGDEVEFTATRAFWDSRWFLGVAAAAAVLLFAVVPALWSGAPARLPSVGDPVPPVSDRSASGQGLATSGQDLTAPGKGLATSGQDLATPGQDLATPGQGPAAPGQDLAAPGQNPAASVQDPATPVTDPALPARAGPLVGAPIAMISIDINPSVELWVDQQERVTAARARNADGETLLAAVEYQGQQVRSVVLALTDAAARQGYFAQDDVEPTVVVGVAPVDAGLLPVDDEERLLTGVMAAAREAVSRQGDAAVVRVAVVAAPATVEQRDRAASLGTTPGRLAVAEAILAVAPADMGLTLEQVLAAPPGRVRNQIRERAGMDPWPEMEKVLRAKPAKGKPGEADAPGADKPGDDRPGQGRGRGGDDPPGNGAPGDDRPGQGRGRGGDDSPGNGAPGDDRPGQGRGRGGDDSPGNGAPGDDRPGQGRGRGGDDSPGNGPPGNNGPGRDAGNRGPNRGFVR